jgi:hypothetical protein
MAAGKDVFGMVEEIRMGSFEAQRIASENSYIKHTT